MSVAFGQSRMVMMNTWADAKSPAAEKKDQISSDEMRRIRALNRAEARIDSLERVLLQLKADKEQVEKENASLLAYNRELVQETVSEARQAREAIPVVDEKAIEEAISFDQCMEASVFQPLFSEIIRVNYTLDEASQTFVGQLNYTYTPEIGQRETRVQNMKGKFTRTRDEVRLHITEIDLIPTDVVFCVNDRSYKSFVKAGPEAAALPYTKVVNFEELKLDYCLF